jgi:hypothetical protein
LTSDAAAERLCVQLGAAPPDPEGLKLVYSGLYTCGKNPPVDAFSWLQKHRINGLKTTAETGKITDVGLYRRTAEILQQVVVQMNTVPARLSR